MGPPVCAGCLSHVLSSVQLNGGGMPFHMGWPGRPGLLEGMMRHWLAHQQRCSGTEAK